MHEVINEVKKIHPQYTIPACILMAIRAKIEFSTSIINRIGKTYPDGNRGVLIIGKSGTGKTRCLKSIFEGLQLETGQVGKFISSAGASTGVGICETLEVYNNSIIGIDELSLDTPAHLHVIKQVANGQIMRPRHKEIDPKPFTGLLLATANAIKIPKSPESLEHMLAVLDRFMLVKAKAPKISANNIMEFVLSGEDSPQINWTLIGKHVTNKNHYDLNDKEEIFLKEIWKEKTKEILDPTRGQWRNCWAAFDICLFVKRFLGSKDISNDDIAKEFIKDMINDCIVFNPVNILWLKPIHELIYEKVLSAVEISIKDIILECENFGLQCSRQYIHRVLDNMIQNRILCRSRRGMYSVKLIDKTGQTPVTQSHVVSALKTQ